MPVANIDPYEPADGRFECVECGARTEAPSRSGACDRCGGRVKNIAVCQE